MHKMFIFIGLSAGSWVGWYLGIHWGFWCAYAVSGVASMVGVYAGWKFAERLR